MTTKVSTRSSAVSEEKFFRSCHVDNNQYFIGDFVLVQEIHQSADEAQVMRIETCCDRGTKYEEAKRIVANCTRFLKNGDIRNFKQDDKELIMDKRKRPGSVMALAVNIKYACKVVHEDDLTAGDKTSFFFHSGFDGKRVLRLQLEDTKPTFPYRLKRDKAESSCDSENQSPVPERRKLQSLTSVSINLRPLRDIAQMDNDTASQSDDLDDVSSEKDRNSGRGNSHKTKERKYIEPSQFEVTNEDGRAAGKPASVQQNSVSKPVTRLRDSKQQVSGGMNSKRLSSRNLIESVNYETDTADRISTRAISDKTKVVEDPYEFLSDDPSPKQEKRRKRLSYSKAGRKSCGESSAAHKDLTLIVTQSEKVSSAAKVTESVKSTNRRDVINHKPAVSSPHSREKTKDTVPRQSRRQAGKRTVQETAAAAVEDHTANRLRKTTAAPQEKQLSQTSRSSRAKPVSTSTVEQFKPKITLPSSDVKKTRSRRFCQDVSLLDTDSSDSEATQSQSQRHNRTSRQRSSKAARVSKSSQVESKQDSDSDSVVTFKHNNIAELSEESVDGELLPKQTSRSSRQTEKVEDVRETQTRRTRQKDVKSKTSDLDTQVKVSTQCSSRKILRRSTKDQTSSRVESTQDSDSDSVVTFKHNNIAEPSENAKPLPKHTRRLSRRTEKVEDVTELQTKRSRQRDIKSTGRDLDSQVEVSSQDSSRKLLSRSAKKKVSYNLDSKQQSDIDDSDEDETFKPTDNQAQLSDSSDDAEPLPKQTRRSSRRTGSETDKKAGATPRSRLRSATLTPSVRDRQKPVKDCGTVLERARAQLHVSVVPDSLPCREDEFANILGYVEGKLESGTGGCLYISGVPGTGKTATVFEVMRHLRENQSDSIPKFKFIDINGMRLTQPHQAFVQIYKCLTGKKVTADHATSLLDALFCKARRQESIVLLVDELDLLMTRKQDVLYNLFDWPTKPRSKLVVLAIANTMDLPERVMMNRVSSRLGLNRMTFQPYTFQQLQEIVLSRLTGISAFDPDAVQLASRKVAAVSGDARRALDISRRSTEVAEADGLQLVNMQHVNRALQEMFSSPKVTAIRNCSFYEKIVLKAVLAEFTRSGLEEATLYQISKHIDVLCAMDRMPTIKVMQMMRICSNLNNIKLLLLECNGKGIYQRVRLNVGQDDVQYALRVDNS